MAVLSSETLGGTSIAQATPQIGTAVGIKGAYAVVAGRQFYADSTLFPVGDLADQAIADNRADGAMAILESFISQVSARAAAGRDGPLDRGQRWRLGLGVLVVLAVLVLGGGAWPSSSCRKRAGRPRPASPRCAPSSTRT